MNVIYYGSVRRKKLSRLKPRSRMLSFKIAVACVAVVAFVAADVFWFGKPDSVTLILEPTPLSSPVIENAEAEPEAENIEDDTETE